MLECIQTVGTYVGKELAILSTQINLQKKLLNSIERYSETKKNNICK